ncbi:urotensin-2 receptor-like [Ornithorhynchus anatinus]|uniref:Urotensin-2 receptor n=1 Tax=Ornithorhynchus anatinus TaxID=9258 RepID=F6TJ59_ORNAN|nr:urotensin-2 receptor-like [Ornithorhynchus anatinus]
MEPTPDGATLPRSPTNSATQANLTSDAPSESGHILVTSFLGCVLAAMCVVGTAGNVYTLVVTNASFKLAGSMSIYIVNLALADLLYLATIPFVVCTYFLRDWYFGDLGCRILFSLDLLTMHASIFFLTAMSTERYLAVAKPLDSVGRSGNYRRVVTCSVWLVSLLLALPTAVLIDLRTSHLDGATKRMCHPTWQLEAYKVYLTVLFHTCILAPGLVICYLYIRLARTYWRSQTSVFLPAERGKRCPRQKVLYMIFAIILTYWACFLPFWLWQLLSIYYRVPGNGHGSTTVVYINFLVTCLAYGNSCINPFLYTLLSKNYKEYLQSHRRRETQPSRGRAKRVSSRKSVSSGSPGYAEAIAVVQIKGTGARASSL